VPLITASILSKKLAAGLDALVMDVKTGSGAFAAELEQARALAHSIVTVAEGAGLSCSALITDQGQVLGDNVGNALEVSETLSYLCGRRRNPRLHELILELGATLLLIGDLVATLDEGRIRLDAVLNSGEAADRFARMVVALGGPRDLLEHHQKRLPAAPVVKPVTMSEAGYLTRIDARAVGLAVVSLGGGRRKASDSIDPRVGLSQVRGLGDSVGPEQPFAFVHAADEASATGAVHAIQRAVTSTLEPPVLNDIVVERVSGRILPKEQAT
jgi:thymidine phosphorylase